MSGRFRVRLVALLCLCASAALAQSPAARSTVRSGSVLTPPLRFIGDSEAAGATRVQRPFTTPALSFVGAAPAAPSARSVSITTNKLDFIGAAQNPAAGRNP